MTTAAPPSCTQPYQRATALSRRSAVASSCSSAAVRRRYRLVIVSRLTLDRFRQPRHVISTAYRSVRRNSANWNDTLNTWLITSAASSLDSTGAGCHQPRCCVMRAASSAAVVTVSKAMPASSGASRRRDGRAHSPVRSVCATIM